DMTVTPGQPVGVSLYVSNRGDAPITITRVSGGGASTGACALSALAPGAAQQCNETVTIPANARVTDIPFTHDPKFSRYVLDPAVPFGVPFAPTPYVATFGLTIGGEAVEKTLPIEARNGDDMMAGEKRSELLVVPALTVTTSPDVIVVPTT